MFNFFKSKGKKEHLRQLELLQNSARKEKIINTFAKKGLLSYNPATHRLFISTQLAIFYLENSEKWQSFLQTIHQWALFHRLREAWNQYFQTVEVAAVREAKRKYASLSKADIQRIRAEARQKVDISAIEAPKVEPFEFFVADIEGTADSSEILVVGNYDGESFEMERYDMVRRFLLKE